MTECTTQSKTQTQNSSIEPWRDTLSVGVVSGIITGIGSAFGGSWGLFLAWMVVWAFILKLPSDALYERPVSRIFVIVVVMIIIGSLFGLILENVTGLK